jgi:hypothetical protein
LGASPRGGRAWMRLDWPAARRTVAHRRAIAGGVLGAADDRAVAIVVTEIPLISRSDEPATPPARDGAGLDACFPCLARSLPRGVVAALGRVGTRRARPSGPRWALRHRAPPERVRRVEPAGVEPASDQAVQPCRLPALRGHVPSTRAPSFPARVSSSFRAVRHVGAVTRRPGHRHSRRPRARRDPPRCTPASRNDRSRSHLRLPGWASAVGRDPLEHCCRTEPSKPMRPLEPSNVRPSHGVRRVDGVSVARQERARTRTVGCRVMSPKPSPDSRTIVMRRRTR